MVDGLDGCAAAQGDSNRLERWARSFPGEGAAVSGWVLWVSCKPCTGLGGCQQLLPCFTLLGETGQDCVKN